MTKEDSACDVCGTTDEPLVSDGDRTLCGQCFQDPVGTDRALEDSSDTGR